MPTDTNTLRASSLFVGPEDQLANVRAWNERHSLDITPEQFEEAEAMKPPKRRVGVPVLVPYLDTIWNTFLSLAAIAARHPVKACRPFMWDYMPNQPESLRLLEGIEHQPGLRWEVIDLWANWDHNGGTTVKDVRGPDSAHAGIIAAAAHFPEWIQSTGFGKPNPSIWLAGYQVDDGRTDSWSTVPILHGSPGGRITFTVCGEAMRDQYGCYAAPVILK